ncbi:MAG: spore germination protein [Firmicutes bacterium]|nr:spore germination protein [Bacillota bacterium]
MFKFIRNLIIDEKKRENNNNYENIEIGNSLEDKISMLKKILTGDDGIVYRRLQTKGPNSIKCSIIFVDSLVDTRKMNESVLRAVMETSIENKPTNRSTLDYFIEKIVSAGEITKSKDVDYIIGSILYGDTILMIDGIKEVLVIDTKGWKTRAICEPLSESNVRGPREGFTESIRVNISLIRRRIRSPKLKFNFRELGRETKTKVCLCYMNGIADKKIVKELITRLEKIDIDGILETGYIEEMIKDAPYSPFKTIGSTERPDVVCGRLLEGRVALICDGTPFVLTLPFIFIEYFQANEDYYKNYIYASTSRLLRITSFFLATSIPAIYVSLVTFHQEMMPTELVMSISAAQQGVPLPTVVEALVMLLVFDIIREAGIRLPAPIGQTVSIVGALVLGQAAVDAKVISAPIVIVTAFTGISSFLLPKMLDALSIIRVVFVILASFLGLYGYIFGVMALSIHLISIRSFGVSYMSNIASLNGQEEKDMFIRAPWWKMYFRPRAIVKEDIVRKEDDSE